MATTTFKAIRELMEDRYGIGRRGQTTVASTKIALTDDFNFGGHSATEDVGPGCEVRITSGASEGNVCRLSSSPVRTTGAMNLDPGAASNMLGKATTLNGAITSVSATSLTLTGAGNFPSAGTYVINIDSEYLLVTDGAGTVDVTVQRGYLNSVAATHTDGSTVTLLDGFEILFRPFSFEGQHGIGMAINQALKLLPEKLMVPITMVTDGDMLASAVASWGTVSDTAAAKSAASFPFGLREMQCTNSGVNGYVPSAAIPVDSSQGYYLEATARVTNATATAIARLDCYDLTGSAALTVDDDNTTQQEPEVLSCTVQTGSATERVEIRIGADENSTVSLWSNVIFMKNGLSEWLVQDRAEVDRLGKLFVARADWRNREFQEIGGEPVQLTEGLWKYQAEASVSGRSLWYEEFRKPAELTADADTTGLPVEDVAAVAAEILLQPFQSQEKWQTAYLKAARASAAVRTRYRGQRTYVNRAPKSIYLARV